MIHPGNWSMSGLSDSSRKCDESHGRLVVFLRRTSRSSPKHDRIIQQIKFTEKSEGQRQTNKKMANEVCKCAKQRIKQNLFLF
mmetsp:Transcript_37339/g.48310  ORF Transcript_37339/g.48310 Transcript_37339/m.48310 type:complete len:83 (+) Transcript_37339:621-869(+)